MATKNNNKIFEILDKVIDEQSDFLASTIQSIETKSGILIATSGTILTILASHKIDENIFSYHWTIILGLTLLVLSFLISLICLLARTFKLRPRVKPFYEDYKNRKITKTRATYLNIRADALEENRNKVNLKAKLYNTSLVLHGVALMLILVGLLVPSIERRWLLMSDDTNTQEEVVEENGPVEATPEAEPSEDNTPQEPNDEVENPSNPDKYDFDVIKGGEGIDVKKTK